MPIPAPAPNPGRFWDNPNDETGSTFLPPCSSRLARWACSHRRDRSAERSPFLPCPACSEQARQNRRHWAGFALACVIAFVLTWLGLAASCGAGGAQ